MSTITSDVGAWGVLPRALIEDLQGNWVAIALYGTLSTFADRHVGDDWTGSRQSIIETCGMSVTSYKRAIKALEDAGWVTVVKRFTADGDRGWNQYVVHVVNRGRLTDDPRSVQIRTDVGPEAGHVPQTPSSDPSSDTSRALEVVDGRFDIFWGLYPRKVDRKKCLKLFDRLMKTVDHEDILTGLEPWLEYWEERGDPSFVPHPYTWLNNDRWMASPPPINGRKKPAGWNAIQRNMEVARNEA